MRFAAQACLLVVFCFGGWNAAHTGDDDECDDDDSADPFRRLELPLPSPDKIAATTSAGSSTRQAFWAYDHTAPATVIAVELFWRLLLLLLLLLSSMDATG